MLVLVSHVDLPSLSAQVGIPKDFLLNGYEILTENDITIYVHNVFEKYDIMDTLAIILNDSLATLVIYGIVPQN